MTDLFERSLDLGLDIFLYGRDKMEGLVDSLASQVLGPRKDARRVAAELIQKGREQREEMEKLIREEITKALNHGNLARRTDLVTKDEIREIVREEIRQALREREDSKPEETK